MRRTKFEAKLKELNLKPEHVALAVDRSAASIKKWITGEYAPNLYPSEMCNLCELLQMDIYKLAKLFEPDEAVPTEGSQKNT